jgi:hypothetical protein
MRPEDAPQTAASGREVAANNPIPKDFAGAFNKALAAFHNWTTEEHRDGLIEPEFVQRHSISSVCNFIEAFNDPMPDNVYQFLCWLAAGQSGTAPDDRSYASGARCLRALRDKHITRHEERRQGGCEAGADKADGNGSCLIGRPPLTSV